MHFRFIYIMPSLSNLTLTLPRMPVFSNTAGASAGPGDRILIFWVSFVLCICFRSAPSVSFVVVCTPVEWRVYFGNAISGVCDAIGVKRVGAIGECDEECEDESFETAFRDRHVLRNMAVYGESLFLMHINLFYWFFFRFCKEERRLYFFRAANAYFQLVESPLKMLYTLLERFDLPPPTLRCIIF